MIVCACLFYPSAEHAHLHFAVIVTVHNITFSSAVIAQSCMRVMPQPPDVRNVQLVAISIERVDDVYSAELSMLHVLLASSPAQSIANNSTQHDNESIPYDHKEENDEYYNVNQLFAEPMVCRVQ
jgi:hypothetical protein